MKPKASAITKMMRAAAAATTASSSRRQMMMFAASTSHSCCAVAAGTRIAVAAAAAAAARRTTLLARSSFATTSSSPSIKKTALYDWHVEERGGNMVEFAGYQLPVYYKGVDHRDDGDDRMGVLKEHLWCRTEGKCSLFDVSHMGQIRWHGKDRVQFLEKMVVSDIAGLAENAATLSLITNANGGILDDTVITNADEHHIYMVVNGATKHADMEHFQNHMQQNSDLEVCMDYLEDSYQLLAVQGPGAAQAVAKLLPSDFNLTKMTFMSGTATTLDGVPNCRITRCGYTGEDGFELAMPAEHAVNIAEKLMTDPTVNPAGLGARDSLRLEAGLCLYGNDIDETTTPVEAVLGWTIGPPQSRRRLQGGFLGADQILTADGKFQKVSRKRVGITGMKAPARQHVEIYDESGETKIGEVTSGTYSPSLQKPIAMGYVATGSSKAGTPVQLKIRDKMQPAEITKMPFVESRYYRIPE